MRRRRGSSFVTKTACTECRKGRAKCDGEKPCARCVSKGGLVCEYDVPMHVRKDDMRQEIIELRRQTQIFKNILELLASGDEPQFIVTKLQQRVPPEEILEQISRRSPLAASTVSGIESQVGRESTRSGQTDGTDMIDSESQNWMDDMSLDLDESETYSFKHGSRWTDIPLGDKLIEQLLLLFFCWEYPIFSSLSKRHFARDFNNGGGPCCSSLLVNAMLAVGCRFSDSVGARMDPDDSDTAGMHCYLEAERLLLLCRGEQSVVVVQGMCLMSTWNASRGDYKSARYYAGQAVQIAVEAGLHRESEFGDVSDDVREFRNTTFWGAFMLDQAWSLATGWLPHISRDGISMGNPSAFDRDELRDWIPYAGDQIPKGLDLRQPSNVHAVYTSLCELSTIIHDTLYATHTLTGSVSSRDTLAQYTCMLNWYSNLPDVLRLGENSTASVLFVHMYYHFVIILIFYPLRALNSLDSNLSELEICTDSANAIVTLIRSFESLYGLRRTPCFLPYIIFASGIVHLGTVDLNINPLDALTQTTQEVAVLQLMSLYHGSSKRASRILLSWALSSSESGVSVEQSSETYVQSPWEPFLKTMTRPSARSRKGSLPIGNLVYDK